MTDSLTRYETTFESTKNLPMTIAIGHGENADMVASFKDNGVDVDLTGFTARAIYQPFSKWGTDEWYECPCEIVNNTVIAHWGNQYDNGDNAVKLFMHLLKDGKVAYPAIYQIRLFETPGFSPSTIEPIPETIDFSQYTLVNAPWALQSDFNTLSSRVDTVSGNVDTLSGNVSTLTGNVENLNANKADVGDFNALVNKVTNLSGNVDTLSGTVGTLSGNVNTLTGNVNTLSTSTLKTSQLITSITSASTDLDVPTGKAVYDAIQEGGGGGGVTGYTVTFANDFGTNSNKYYYMTSAPVTFVFADGTTETIDVEANKVQLRGRVIQNVIAVICNHWESDSWSLWADRDYTHLSINSLGMDINLLAPTYGGLYGDITPLAIFKPFAPVMVKRAYGFFSCLLKGTLVRLANGQDKPIEEITHDDNLLVWDFDNGCLSTAKPLWIKQAQKAPFYFRNLLSDGHELLTVGEEATGGHRMFDADKSGFLYTAETVGDGIYTLDGIAKHKSCERIDAECEYYNIITGNHFNLFANGILTSCKLNNLYPISGMKFKKDENREFRPFEAYDVPLKYYKGLRLAEQCGDIGELTEYVKRLIDFEKQESR